MTDFELRPMEPGDGPAIDALMRENASTTDISLTTHYQHDIYQALLAQHPTLFGVVATTPGSDGLAGFATAFIEEVMVGGRAYPAAQLENLKVRQDLRRHGLGARLAAWRIDEARRRFGGEGIITTGLERSNAASLATARRMVHQRARARPRRDRPDDIPGARRAWAPLSGARGPRCRGGPCLAGRLLRRL